MRTKKSSKIIENILIEDIVDQGNGFGKVDGKIIFVEKTIPGDVVTVRLVKNKTDYAIGIPIAFSTYSKLRVEPFCKHFGICGGCTWQSVDYETQLQFKHKLVVEAFKRIGKIDIPHIPEVFPSPYQKYYRNKLEYTFSNKRWLFEEEMHTSDLLNESPALGFHIKKLHDKILDIQHCYLQPAPSNEIRLALKSYATIHQISFYDLKTKAGYLRNVFIRNTSLQDVMLILVVGENKPEILHPFLNHIQNIFPEITSIFYAINTKVNDYFYDLDAIHFYGKEYMLEQIDTIQYKLGPKSFFQTNTVQTVNLYHKTLAFADLKPTDVVYDLYTGLGSIALLASKQCKEVIGVEMVASAIEDAKSNAKFNNITNCTFICGDMAKTFNEDFISKYGKPNVVITDPPRAGMDKSVTLTLLDLAPEKIVYVSCNPATQARDLLLLSEKYTVVKMQPVDMFPQTYHVENIVLLNLN